MFETTYMQHNMNSLSLRPTGRHTSPAQAHSTAIALYNAAAQRGWSRLWQTLSGRTRQLQDLSQLTSGRTRSSHYAGVRTISLSKVVGTEGRSTDFDADFKPLTRRTHQRWLSIARAVLTDTPLPPVELIQVGTGEQAVYYVRDGHHRVSVALACGQTDIEAEVTVIEIE